MGPSSTVVLAFCTMTPYVAFFDDSGNPEPDHRSEFYALGLIVVPFYKVKDLNSVVSSQFGTGEVKCSTFLSVRRKLCGGGKRVLNKNELALARKLGLRDCTAANSFMSKFLNMVSQMGYLNAMGIVIHKKSSYSRFRSREFVSFSSLSKSNPQYKAYKNVLTRQILDNALPYLLQRLQYFLRENDGLAVVIGDENSYQRQMYAVHATLPAGAGIYTSLSRIVNNVVFGSSEYNPGLQVADWVAHALNRWARSDPTLFASFKGKFRGYPLNIKGRGLVLVPDNHSWPPI